MNNNICSGVTPESIKVLKEIEPFFWHAAAVFCVITLSLLIVRVGRKIPTNLVFFLALSGFSIISRSLKNVIFGNHDGTRIIINGICVVILQIAIELFIFETLFFKAKIKC